MTMIKNVTLPLLLTATLATTTRAFVSPSLIVTRNDILQRSSPRRFYQNGNDDKQSNEIPFHPPPPQPILPRVNVDKTPTTTTNTQYSSNKNTVEEPSVELILPSLPIPAVATKEEEEEEKKPSLLKSAVGLTQKRVKALQKWKTRPGVKFRLRLGVVTTAIVAISSVVIPRFSNIRLLALIKKWITHRGFQGIAAFGRSVAYIWALLVGYPRILDRRAKERQRHSHEQVLERRRQQLHRLAGEVVRLRQELTSLDAEIRSFRREIISLKAYTTTSSTTTNKQQQPSSSSDDNDNNRSNSNNNNSEEIQKAINMEMGHLMQLRSDTQAALDAARQTWAEFRSKSPSEIWDDTLLPY